MPVLATINTNNISCKESQPYVVSYGDVESKTRYPAMPTKVARKAKIGKCHEAWGKEEP
jgi:hypothetical protein